MPGELRLRPWTIKKALPFVQEVHRRLPKIQGAMWCVSVRCGSEVVGVALVGHPAQEWMQDDEILSVLRVAVKEGYPNACSMLYGACSKAARGDGGEEPCNLYSPGRDRDEFDRFRLGEAREDRGRRAFPGESAAG